MSAWSTLIANSSLVIGTAWQHLNNQVGGGSSAINIYGENVAVIESDIQVVLELSMDYYATIETDIRVALDDKDYLVSLDKDFISTIDNTDNTAIVE